MTLVLDQIIEHDYDVIGYAYSKSLYGDNTNTESVTRKYEIVAIWHRSDGNHRYMIVRALRDRFGELTEHDTYWINDRNVERLILLVPEELMVAQQIKTTQSKGFWNRNTNRILKHLAKTNKPQVEQKLKDNVVDTLIEAIKSTDVKPVILEAKTVKKKTVEKTVAEEYAEYANKTVDEILDDLDI